MKITKIELIGTEKQIAWAEDIRDRMINLLISLYGDFETSEKWNGEKSSAIALRGAVECMMSNANSAKWWIEHHENNFRTFDDLRSAHNPKTLEMYKKKILAKFMAEAHI